MSEPVVSSEAVTALVALLGAAFGAALGALLAHRYSRKRDHLEMKRDVLRRLMGHRWELTPKHGTQEGAVFTALNEIPVVFAGHKEVERALDAFRISSINNLLPLAMAMARSAEVPHQGWTQELFDHPFTPGPGYGGDGSPRQGRPKEEPR